MISPLPNCCKVCVFSPLLEFVTSDEKLSHTIDEIKNIDADVIYIRENSQNGEKLWLQFETVKNVQRVFSIRTMECSLMMCLKGDRFDPQNTDNWDGNFNYDGATIKLSGYKTFIVEKSSQRVYVIGLAALNIQSLLVDDQHSGDNLLKYLKLEEWFNSNKAIYEKEGKGAYSIPYSFSDKVIKTNLESKVLSEKKPEKMEKRRFKEYISHFIHFKKPQKPKPVFHEKLKVDVKTLFFKVTAKGQAHSVHRFDHDEKYHYFISRERSVPNTDLTERVICSTSDFEYFAHN